MFTPFFGHTKRSLCFQLKIKFIVDGKLKIIFCDLIFYCHVL